MLKMDIFAAVSKKVRRGRKKAARSISLWRHDVHGEPHPAGQGKAGTAVLGNW